MAGQLVAHGVITNVKLETFYKPGLGAVVFAHVPLGTWSRPVVTGPWD